MSKTCAYTLTRIHAGIQTLTRRPITRLEVVDALLNVMDCDKLLVLRRRLETYRLCLRNWQIADEEIWAEIQKLRAWKSENLMDEPPRLQLKAPYERYKERARACGLTLMRMYTFRKRAYYFPSPLRYQDERRGDHREARNGKP